MSHRAVRLTAVVLRERAELLRLEKVIGKLFRPTTSHRGLFSRGMGSGRSIYAFVTGGQWGVAREPIEIRS
jgi:hypothetical protein